MERPSEASHSGGSTWKVLLMTASILSCWIQPTSAQGDNISVVPSPPYGTVGSNITFNIQGFSGKALSYTWYRNAVDTPNWIGVYSASSGEQKSPDTQGRVFPNGSLLILDLTFNDTGLYILQIAKVKSGEIVRAEGNLTVYAPLSKPTINSTNMAPVENKDNVSLTCQTLSQNVTYWWSKPEGSSGLLSTDNRTLTIINVTREDQGPYQCEIRNPASVSRSDPFTLKVTSQKSTAGGNGSSLSGGTITGIVIGVLAGVALIGVLIYFLFFRKSGGASKQQLTEHKSSASNHSQACSDSSTNKTEEVSYASVNFTAQKPPTMTQSRSPIETIYSELK